MQLRKMSDKRLSKLRWKTRRKLRRGEGRYGDAALCEAITAELDRRYERYVDEPKKDPGSRSLKVNRERFTDVDSR